MDRGAEGLKFTSLKKLEFQKQPPSFSITVLLIFISFILSLLHVAMGLFHNSSRSCGRVTKKETLKSEKEEEF